MCACAQIWRPASPCCALLSVVISDTLCVAAEGVGAYAHGEALTKDKSCWGIGWNDLPDAAPKRGKSTCARCLNSVDGRNAYKGQQCVPVKPFVDTNGKLVSCERPGTAVTRGDKIADCKLACYLLVSKNQGKKGGYQYCSNYMGKMNPYIATKTDLECQLACLDTPGCIYATRYSDQGRAYPKKNCHLISSCGTMNHYADNTGCVKDKLSCFSQQCGV